MKRISSMLLVALFLSLSGCKSKPISGNQPLETNDVSELSKESVTLSGDFQSKRGVMARISCFCSMGGTLTQANEEGVQLCFDKDVPQDCSAISVTGKYVTKTIDPGPNSPCASGTMTYLKVDEFKCK